MKAIRLKYGSYKGIEFNIQKERLLYDGEKMIYFFDNPHGDEEIAHENDVDIVIEPVEELLGRYDTIKAFMPTGDGNEKEITLMYNVEEEDNGEEWIGEVLYNENELTAEDIEILEEDGLLTKLVVSGIHGKLFKEGYRKPENVISEYGLFKKDRSEYLKYG